MPSVKNPKLGDIDVIFELLNDNRTKRNNCHLPFEDQIGQWMREEAEAGFFSYF